MKPLETDIEAVPEDTFNFQSYSTVGPGQVVASNLALGGERGERGDKGEE